MNATLITPEQKTANAKARKIREWVRVKGRRRESRLTPLMLAVAAAPEIICLDSWEESSALLGHLNGAKAVASRLLRRAFLIRNPNLDYIPEEGAGFKDVEAPTRRIRSSKLPAVYPWLVCRNEPAPMSLVEALKNIPDVHVYAKLDWLHSTAGLDWDTCAELLHKRGHTREPIGGDVLAEMATARTFWKHWNEARKAYAAAVTLAQVRPARGEWGLVESTQLTLLFPGFQAPKAQARDQYLIRLKKDGTGIHASMLAKYEFHSVRGYKPLFTLS